MWFPKFISWRRDLSGITNWQECFSKKTAKKIRSAEKRLAEIGFYFENKKLDEAGIAAFKEIYEAYISSKPGGVIYDVIAYYHNGLAAGKDMYLLGVYDETNAFRGGAVYSLGKDALQVAYRVFKHNLDIKLPIGVSHLAEKEFFHIALSQYKQWIYHGKDRNGYGLNSAIGLAEFKMSLGCDVYVSKLNEGEQFIIDEQVLDASSEKDILLFGAISEIESGLLPNTVLISVQNKKALEEKYPVLFNKKAVEVKGE